MYELCYIWEMNFLSNLFGDQNTKKLRKYHALVPVINSFEEQLITLTDEDLKAKTSYFRERLAKGDTLDNLLPEAFAVVREASRRLSGERHYDAQLIGGMIIHDGIIAEMRTGEGKTLVATLPAYLNALKASVHVVTVNDYLAKRDVVWMGQIYSFLGLQVSVLNGDQSYVYTSEKENKEIDEERDEEGSYAIIDEFLKPVSRVSAYQADIVYGTNSQFGFDYLRDNIEYDKNNIRQTEHVFAIVDEIDSILIDEARTPLIISAPSVDPENLYKIFANIVVDFEKDIHYTAEEKYKSVRLTDAGIEKAEKALGVDNIYTEKGVKYVHHLETAIKAHALYRANKEYVVKDNKIIIVDEFTGRLQPGRRWSDGLHQAVEAKEGVTIEQESRTYASITYQNYFKMYDKLAGMTGTAETSSEEFFKVYQLDTIVVPTHRPILRVDRDDLIFQTEQGKFMAITQKIKELNQKGQPVLIGTVSIEKNEMLSAFLTKEGVKHEVLNAKNHEEEGNIIARAGHKGAVTIATNMAGRGVDIKLGGVPFNKEAYEEVKSLGGLFVIGTERHEARRIDNQLRGRSGRQGDPGETQFYVAMSDDLMRIFSTDIVKNMMGRLGIPEDQPIQNKIITRSLESAQEKIEGLNFDQRKQLLAYDNVINTQRDSIYKRRRKVLFGEDTDIKEELDLLVSVNTDVNTMIQNKITEIGLQNFSQLLRRSLLQTIDMFWIDHLENMSYIRSSVALRAYGQRDPLIEYQKEGKILFENLKNAITNRVISLIENIDEQAFKREEERVRQAMLQAQKSGGTAAVSNLSQKAEFGRNDLVTIIKDGQEQTLKYKKAELLLSQGWVIKK
jgi:preprotein translocase subunit SecA